MVAHEEALTILARSIEPRDAACMLEAVKLMAAICLVPPDGQVTSIAYAFILPGKFELSCRVTVRCGSVVLLFLNFHFHIFQPSIHPFILVIKVVYNFRHVECKDDADRLCEAL